MPHVRGFSLGRTRLAGVEYTWRDREHAERRHSTVSIEKTIGVTGLAIVERGLLGLLVGFLRGFAGH